MHFTNVWDRITYVSVTLMYIPFQAVIKFMDSFPPSRSHTRALNPKKDAFVVSPLDAICHPHRFASLLALNQCRIFHVLF